MPDQQLSAEPPPEREEEGGGAAARGAAFAAERFTRIRARAADGEADSSPMPGGRAMGAATAPEAAVSPGFRRDLIRQYRERQEETIPGAGAQRAEGRPGAPGIAMGAPAAPPAASTWIPIGPSVARRGQAATNPPCSGRITGIAVALGGKRLYVGAANGGVWRSLDGGRSWAPLMEAFDLNPTHYASDSLAVGALALVPGKTPAQDRIYVGSGEAYAAMAATYYGVGPIVSVDGGANWHTEPVAPGSPELAGSGFYSVVVDPADAERAIAGTNNGIYRREADGRGGYHWAHKPLTEWSSPVSSVVAARSTGVTTYYAAQMYDQVYTSTDGATWTPIGQGFPPGEGRISLAVQENNPRIVYALTASGKVLRLDTAEDRWRLIEGVPAPQDLVGAQGWYDLAIAVAPNNPNRIFVGGASVWSRGQWCGALYRCEISAAADDVTAMPIYIGFSIHGDIHAIEFPPGDASRFWVGCDGGVFYCPTAMPGVDTELEPRNAGLAISTLNHISLHPSEDAVMIAGAQDQGSLRYTGEAAWLHIAPGDGGYSVIHWDNPYRILVTYTYATIWRFNDGGARYTHEDVSIQAPEDQVLFYAPLAGTPPNPREPHQADRVVFGTDRLWISDTFGGDWRSLPKGDSSDRLNSPIRAIAFASYTRIYAGTLDGRVFCYDQTAQGWKQTRLDFAAGKRTLPVIAPITDIAVDTANPRGTSFYITLGGGGDYRHVWYYDGARWLPRSGPGAQMPRSLLDVQHNAIVVDPARPSHLYVGADIGVWRSTDRGVTWQPYSEGLPDAAVMDIKLHAARRLLRCSTYGRGVYERPLDSATVHPVEIYVRHTQLDKGRAPSVDDLPDPTRPGIVVQHWLGPDVQVVTPDTHGWSPDDTGVIDFASFPDWLTDQPRFAPLYSSPTVTQRVYVQVHNRGVARADGVRVMLLAAHPSVGLPPLPEDAAERLHRGEPLETSAWRTVGIATLDDLRAGMPRVAAFDLTCAHRPPPATLASENRPTLLALIDHDRDPYAAASTQPDWLGRNERRAAYKNLHTVQFAEANAPPAVLPLRLHNPHAHKAVSTRLVVNLFGYPGQARLYTPALAHDGDPASALEGWRGEDHLADFKRWADDQREWIAFAQMTEYAYDARWAQARLDEIAAISASGQTLVPDTAGTLALRRLHQDAGAHVTLYLWLACPPQADNWTAHTLEVMQYDEANDDLLGAYTARVETLAVQPGMG